MTYEFLKKLFGTPKEGEQPKAMTYDELEAAINAESGIKLANLAEGGYVSKNKFDDKETELSGVKKQLEAANTQIQSFKDQDVDGIKQKVTEWETKYNTDTQALKDQLAAQERSHTEEMFMSGYNFTSKPARNGVLAELQGKKFQIDNGVLLGAKEFMQSLMENEDYKGAFVTEKKGDEGEGAGGNGGSGAGAAGGAAGGAQQLPRFSQGTNGSQGGDNGGMPTINFGFTRIRQPKKDE